MRQFKVRHLNSSQGGFASIMIALMFILVLSLITTGFVEFSDREQQDTLNSQLAAEAQDAADSGINDVEHDLTAGDFTNLSATDLNGQTCITTPTSTLLPSSAYSSFSEISPSGSAKITCLSVNLTPPSLTNSGIEPGTEWYQVFTPTTPIDSLSIQWTSADQHNNPITSALDENLTDTSWNNYRYAPVLQISLTPVQATGNINRGQELSDDLNFYLYPSTTGGNTITYSIGAGNYGSSTNGQSLSGDCTPSNTQLNCSATVNGLSTTYTGAYLATVIPYYDEASVTIDGTAGGAAVNFTGQAQIDVTAKAQSVVKRLLATIPTSANTAAPTTPTLPAFSIQASNICKRLSTQPGITNYVGGIAGDENGVASVNDACKLN